MRHGRRHRPSRIRAFVLAFVLLLPAGASAGGDGRAVLERQYGLQLISTRLQAAVAPEVDRPDRPVRFTDLPPGDEDAALRSLGAALAVYPPGFIRRFLHRVAMAGDITVFGETAGGLFHGDMVAISYFNVRSPASAAFDTDTLHHELSSIVRDQVLFNVTSWTAANPPGFRYMSLDEYKKVLANPGSVDGDGELHRAGFVSAYGQTSLDNDWNTYAEKVFGHGRAFAREITAFPRMQKKTWQLLDTYESFDPGFAAYFKRTGLRAAAGG